MSCNSIREIEITGEMCPQGPVLLRGTEPAKAQAVTSRNLLPPLPSSGPVAPARAARPMPRRASTGEEARRRSSRASALPDSSPAGMSILRLALLALPPTQRGLQPVCSTRGNSMMLWRVQRIPGLERHRVGLIYACKRLLAPHL